MTPQPKTSSGFFKPRDTRKVAAQSGVYSRRVGVLRWALPIFALLVGLALLAWPMISAKNLKKFIASSIPNLMIENLHMNGLDEKGEPYSLTATRALQSTDSKNIIDLVKPLGELTLKSGTWLAGKAEQGRFDQNTDKLWLGGDVEFFHDGGYQFTTSDAQFDLKNNLAWGERPVVIQGAFGVIHGQGFRILSGGKVVIVTGHSTATLNLRNAQPSDKPAVDKANSQMER